jgi:hypothetical protein
MSDNIRHPSVGVAIRMGGIATLAISWLAGRELWRLHDGHDASALCFLLALVTFLAGCAGSAMLVVGPHLLDKVEVSRRWARGSTVSHLPLGDDHDLRR